MSPLHVFRMFQQMSGLPQTGQPDPATLQQTQLPRCGGLGRGHIMGLTIVVI